MSESEWVPQRAALTAEINGHKEIDYSPAGQLLVGMKFSPYEESGCIRRI